MTLKRVLTIARNKDLLTAVNDWLNRRVLDLMTVAADSGGQQQLILFDRHEFTRLAQFMTIYTAQQHMLAAG